MALTKMEKQQIIKEFARDEKDTGSTEVQIILKTFSKKNYYYFDSSFKRT